MSLFNRVVVVGLGLIGGSFAAAIRKLQAKTVLVGVDFGEALDTARGMALLDAFYLPPALPEAVLGADLIVLATPVRVTMRLLNILGDCLDDEVLVTDVGGAKAAIMAEAGRCLGKSVYFLGGHPMAGAEYSGLQHAKPDLFAGCAYALIGGEQVPPPRRDAFVKLLRKMGSEPCFMDAKTHDQLVASLSHLPQVLSLALMRVAGRHLEKIPDALQLAGRSFRDMTRVAMSPYDIWADVFATNADNIANEIDCLIAVLEQIRRKLTSSEMEKLFHESGTLRSKI